jgi:nucleotide-binding universal stress UspA family protein
MGVPPPGTGLAFELGMDPIGSVLVATDFSGSATRAVERAARLPMLRGATLTVLHVTSAGTSGEDRADVERMLVHASSVAAESLRHAGRDDVQVASRLVDGTPAFEIVRAARRRRCELVVVGRHGERRFRELLLGSTAERVVRHGDTPVLVVASRAPMPYERPLVAVDCADPSLLALNLAWRLASPSAHNLDVVYAYEPIPQNALRRVPILGEAARQYYLHAKERAEAAVEAFLAAGDVHVPVTVVVREGDPRQAILDLAVQHDTDLLAVGTHGYAGLAHVVLGSVAERTLRYAPCPVLTVKAR